MMMLPWVHHRVPKGQVDPPVYPLHTSIVLTKVRQKIGVERPVSLWDVLFGLAGTIECAMLVLGSVIVAKVSMLEELVLSGPSFDPSRSKPGIPQIYLKLEIWGMGAFFGRNVFPQPLGDLYHTNMRLTWLLFQSNMAVDLTLPKFNIAPEKLPSHPTIIFQRLC